MKSTGIVRQIDNLGRIVIPKEIRKRYNIQDNEDALEIFVDDNDCIVLKKYEPSCIFCKDASNIINFKGHNVCASCLDELRKLK